ncbi:MAG: autotransporter outer membrane beta-barrel domain-containing protein, partial [Opitutaceae bacterium]|nr:autotransporter outer membrane beta-barrel domain-containing protein [Opitutaceae bacterium]
SRAAAPYASGCVPVRPAPASSLPWAAYLSASGGGGAAYNDSNAPGYNHTLGLFALGVERALHARLVFGARVGYHKTAAKLRADSGRVDASGWHALAYAGWQFPQGTRFHAVLRHASYDYDTRRHILSPAVMAPDRAAALGSYYDYTAAGSTSGSSTAAALSLSHDWKFGALRDWKTGPIALLAAESVTVDAFSETGTDNGPQAAMRVGRQIPESLRTRLGWRLGWEASDLLDNSAWFLDLRLAWQREHRDTARPVTGSFTNPEYEIAGPVRVLGNKQPRDTLVAGLGVQYRHSRRLRAALAYDLETGAHDTTHTATLSATLRW